MVVLLYCFTITAIRHTMCEDLLMYDKIAIDRLCNLSCLICEVLL